LLSSFRPLFTLFPCLPVSLRSDEEQRRFDSKSPTNAQNKPPTQPQKDKDSSRRISSYNGNNNNNTVRSTGTVADNTVRKPSVYQSAANMSTPPPSTTSHQQQHSHLPSSPPRSRVGSHTSDQAVPVIASPRGYGGGGGGDQQQGQPLHAPHHLPPINHPHAPHHSDTAPSSPLKSIGQFPLSSSQQNSQSNSRNVTPRGSLIGGALSALSGIRSSMISPRLGSTVNITPVSQEQFHLMTASNTGQQNHHHNDLETGHTDL
jgi:hypothetical protein